MQGGELEQISSEEFSKLFGSDKRTLQIQDANGKDTGIQYDFIPHVESESVPESATYTFFLRTGDPKLFLFDPNLDDSKEIVNLTSINPIISQYENIHPTHIAYNPS